jgi:DNA-binding LacI/PurR family transcriptional regulator
MALRAINAVKINCKSAVQSALSVAIINSAVPIFWNSSDLTTFLQPVERMAESAVATITERVNNINTSAEQQIFHGLLTDETTDY